MGFSLSWLAVKDISESRILDAFGARKTGKSDEVPDWDLGYMERASAWRFVFVNRDDIEQSFSSCLQKLSSDSELVAVFVEEHVMYSRASCWNNAKVLWRVEHDNERGGLKDIRWEGAVPRCFKGIYKDMLEQLKNDSEPCDYLFDVPTLVAQDLTGFKHDEFAEPADVFWELVRK